MKGLFREVVVKFFTVIFISVLFIILGMEKTLSKELKIPLYIIKEQDNYEIFLISEYLENHEIGEVKLMDKTLNKNIGIKIINDRKILSEGLINGNEYIFEVNLKNKLTNKRDMYTQKFKYISNNLNVQNVSFNSYDITVDYDRKNLILIDGIDIYGKQVADDKDEFDFTYKKSSLDLENNYKSKLKVGDVCLKPESIYNIYSVVKFDNDINVVSVKNIKTKPFKITSLKSKMVSDRKIKLEWEVSNKNLKFLNDGSIRIYVKKANYLNYPSIPSIKIADENTFSVEVDTGEVSPFYEIKLVYDFCGKKFEKIVEQKNDFHKIHSNLELSGLRNLNLTFGFDNKFKFKDGEVLNIYLVDEDNISLEPKKIFSERIDSILFNPNHKLVFSDLHLNHKYKIFYEIVYKDGKILRLKEDKFKTSDFNLKKFDVNISSDKQKNLKLNMKWELPNSKFEFLPGDSISFYIKDKNSSSYPQKPYFYKDSNLNNIKSLSIDIANDAKGGYDIKLVYFINGKEYITFNEFYVKKDLVKTFSMNGEESNPPVTPEEELFVRFNATIKEQKFNRATIDVKFDNNINFEEGDLLQIYRKLKTDNSSNYKLHAQYEHTKASTVEPSPPEEGDTSTEGDNNNQTGNDNSQSEGGSSSESSKLGVSSSKSEDITQKLDFKKITSIDVDYLVPDREYEVKVVLRTKNDIFGDAITLPLPVKPNVDGESGGGSTEGNDGTGGDSGSSPSGYSKSQQTQTERNNSDSSTEEDKYNTSVMPDYIEHGIVDSKFVVSKTLNVRTTTFEIKTFTPETIKPNSAVLKWEISETSPKFNEDDKVEIYVKRKITNGYPVGNSFIKTGSGMNDAFSGQVVVKNMKMDYTAKLVYTISGVKFEKEVDFKTTFAETSATVTNITEHCAELIISYPQDYIFMDGDVLEIYLKGSHESEYDSSPVIYMINIEGNNLKDNTVFNLNALNPKMVYDVLIRIKNKANDIPDYTTQFITKAIILENCRIESMNGNNIRIKTDMVNDPEVFEFIQLYLDIFCKEKGQKTYMSEPIASVFMENALDCEVTLPDKFKEYDFLVSFNPHGFFNNTLFIEFELEYGTIKPIIETTDVEEEKAIKKVYTLNWSYPSDVTLMDDDKVNIYLKELLNTPPENNPEKPQEEDGSSKNNMNNIDNSENENNNSNDNIGDIENENNNTNDTDNDNSINTPPSMGYKKIHTVESGANLNTSFNIESFLSDNKKYEVLVEVESKGFRVGPGKIEVIVDKLVLDKDSEEVFEVPIKVKDFNGIGDKLTYKLPDLGDIKITDDMGISCDINNIFCELVNDEINIKGLVPCKTYENIQVKVQIENGKEITFALENIKLEPEEKAQEFLYNVYQRSFLRDPDEGGYQYWIDRLKKKDIAARDFVDNLLFAEKEFSEMDYTTDELITVLYSIIVNRDPDSEGLMFWIDLYNNEIIINANGDAFKAKRYIVDRMVNEKEFEKLIINMGLKY